MAWNISRPIIETLELHAVETGKVMYCVWRRGPVAIKQRKAFSQMSKQFVAQQLPRWSLAQPYTHLDRRWIESLNLQAWRNLMVQTWSHYSEYIFFKKLRKSAEYYYSARAESVKGVQLSLYSASVQVTGWSLHIQLLPILHMAVRLGPVFYISQINLHSSMTPVKATKILWCMHVCWIYTQLDCSYLCDGVAGMWGLSFSCHCLYEGQATSHWICCVLLCTADETVGRKPVQIARAHLWCTCFCLSQ
jgi:hypothetical protein